METAPNTTNAKTIAEGLYEQWSKQAAEFARLRDGAEAGDPTLAEKFERDGPGIRAEMNRLAEKGAHYVTLSQTPLD